MTVWIEVTEARYTEMLEILPRGADGVKRYYEADRPLTVRAFRQLVPADVAKLAGGA